MDTKSGASQVCPIRSMVIKAERAYLGLDLLHPSRTIGPSSAGNAYGGRRIRQQERINVGGKFDDEKCRENMTPTMISNSYSVFEVMRDVL